MQSLSLHNFVTWIYLRVHQKTLLFQVLSVLSWLTELSIHFLTFYSIDYWWGLLYYHNSILFLHSGPYCHGSVYFYWLGQHFTHRLNCRENKGKNVNLSPNPVPKQTQKSTFYRMAGFNWDRHFGFTHFEFHFKKCGYIYSTCVKC